MYAPGLFLLIGKPQSLERNFDFSRPPVFIYVCFGCLNKIRCRPFIARCPAEVALDALGIYIKFKGLLLLVECIDAWSDLVSLVHVVPVAHRSTHRRHVVITNVPEIYI